MRLSVRAALTPPHAQVLEWQTSQFQELVPNRHADLSPALCTICVLSSVGQSTRLRIWGSWVQIPQSVPYTGLV